MLVVEKVFGIKIKDDSKKEDLCRKLSKVCCFDKKNYRLDGKIRCEDCQFKEEDEDERLIDCDSRIYDWLLSEYKEKG
jgi:hypothetical protein